MKINEIKIGIVLNYIIIFLNMIIGIVYTPILTNNLGQSEYGLYSLISSIISYLTILDLGFGNAIVIYTIKYKENNQKEKEQKLHGMFFLIYTFIGIIASIIGFTLCINVNKLFGSSMTLFELKKAKILMEILTFNLALTFPLSIFSSIITAYEKFTFARVLNIVRIIINPIIMIILLKLGYKSIALAILTTILNIGSLIISMIYCIKNLKIKLKFGKLDNKLLKEIFNYSFFISLNIIVDKANWNIDQFILGAISGTVAVAIYSVASQLNNIYLNFSSSISSVLLPKIAKMQEKNASDEKFTSIFIKTGRIQFVILALIITGFILYGQEFISILWVGPNYSDAYIIACILMLPVTIPLIQSIGISIIQVKNKVKFRTIVLFLISIANIFISIPLSKLYGGVGSALGTAISLIIGQGIILNIFYYTKLHINIPKFWKEIFKISLPVVFTMLIGVVIKKLLPINSILILILEIIIYSVIYIFNVYRLGLNVYEKNLICKPINKILAILKGDKYDIYRK